MPTTPDGFSVPEESKIFKVWVCKTCKKSGQDRNAIKSVSAGNCIVCGIYVGPLSPHE